MKNISIKADKHRGWQSRRIILRYSLLQLPAILVLGLVLTGLRLWLQLDLWIVTAVMALWIVKDIVLYPLTWRAYDTSLKDVRSSLDGACGVARDRLDPAGYIVVHGQLWQAEAVTGDRPIEPGTAVVVTAANGLTLVVQKARSGE